MWFKVENQIVELKIYAKPNAKKTGLLKINDNELQISIHAKPQDGEANKELINFISKQFKIPKTKIILLRGENSRHKQLRMPLNSVLEHWLKNPSF